MNRRTTLPVLLFAACIAFSLSSCSPRMIRDDSLHITVEPEPVVRGKVGTVSVDAPMDASEVIGVVRVAGSPQFIFRKDRKRGNWYFTDKMPVSAWNPPGRYTIRIIVKEPPAKPRYAEREIELK